MEYPGNSGNLAPQPMVTILRYPRTPARSTVGVTQVPLDEALTREWPTDVHVQAAVASHGRRACRADIGGATIAIGVLMLDVDCAEVHGTPNRAPVPWREGVRAKVDRLALTAPAPFIYMTRGGARLVWRLPEPFAVASDDDARKWKAGYLATVAWLEQAVGLECDKSCADWQRLFRAPHGTRDPDGPPEYWPTYGDPHAINVIALVEPDGTSAPRSPVSAAAGRQRAAKGIGCVKPGLLFELVRARDEILSVDADGATILCPNRSQHTTPDMTARLYGASESSGVGTIACVHNHCCHLKAPDWVELLRGPDRVSERVARIVGTGGDGESVLLRLQADDGGSALGYVKVQRWMKERWAALWNATDVDPPCDRSLAPGSDYRATLDELRGRRLRLEVDQTGKIRRLLPLVTGDAA